MLGPFCRPHNKLFSICFLPFQRLCLRFWHDGWKEESREQVSKKKTTQRWVHQRQWRHHHRYDQANGWSCSGMESQLFLSLSKEFLQNTTFLEIEGALWCSGSCFRLVIRRLWVWIPLGAYDPRQGVLSTIVSLDPGVVNGYPAGIYSFECSFR